MFKRISLAESFEFVASPDEWRVFRSFGEVTGVDLWINSMATGGPSTPGKLDECDRLRSTFLGRVLQRLRSGDWMAEGFDPAKGPELRPIPQQLWQVLEFSPYDDEVSGRGFKFVSIVISNAQREKSIALVLDSAGKVALHDIIEITATDDEAAKYAKLRSAASSPAMWILGASETEYEGRHRLCRALQDRIWQRVLPKLVSAEWSAEGLVPGEVEKTRIPAHIWTELQCDFSKDEAYSAPDLGLHFYRVVIDLQPPPKQSITTGSTRRQLNDWLRTIAQEQRDPVRRSDLLQEAQTELGNTSITENLLDECLRAEGLGPVLLFRGRPPK